MNQQSYKKNFVVGVVAIGAIAGVAVGFMTAHKVTGEMGTGGVSAPTGLAGEKEEMTDMPMAQMDMKKMPPAGEESMKGMAGMPGMAGTPSGAVVVPAVARSWSGTRSPPGRLPEAWPGGR